MQRGSVQLLLILVALLFVVGAGVYFLQSNKKIEKIFPTPYNTYNNYNNYSNQALGFEWQYSKDLTVKEDSEEEYNERGNGNFRKNFKGYVGYEPAKPLGAAVVLDKSSSYDTSPFSVWVFDNPKELTIEQWFKDYWYYPYLWGVFDWTSKGHVTPDTEATISGQLAKSKIVTYQPGKPKFIYTAKDQKMYLFRILGETGEKILSKFKFLGAEQQTSCKITGCSGQICSDKDVVTTCEFLPKYACYKKAICEKQPSGQCGWTGTEELNKCLKQF